MRDYFSFIGQKFHSLLCKTRTNIGTFKKIQQKYTTAIITSRLKLYGNEQQTKMYKDYSYMPTILEHVNIGGNGPKKQSKFDKLGGFHLL